MRTISREGDYTVLSLTIHWEFSSLCGGAGHGIGKYICSLKTERTLFLIRKQQSFASLVSGATPWLAPPASWKRTESGLGVGMVGKSGREISEICSLVTGCKIGQGSRLVARWIERDTCSAGKDGEAGSIIDVEKKFDTLWMAEHIAPHICRLVTSILNSRYSCKICRWKEFVFSQCLGYRKRVWSTLLLFTILFVNPTFNVLSLTDQQKGIRSKQDVHGLKGLKQKFEWPDLWQLHKMDQCQKYQFQSSCRFRLSCKKRYWRMFENCAKQPVA